MFFVRCIIEALTASWPFRCALVIKLTDHCLTFFIVKGHVLVKYR